MSNRPFTLFASFLFGLGALLHLFRALVSHFPITVGSHHISVVASIIAAIISAILCWGLFRESRK
jgi:hypothetical protein